MKGMNGWSRGSACSSTVSTRLRVGGSHVRLRQLDVPIAEVVPEEVVERVDSLVELVRLDGRRDLARGLVQARDNPAVVQRPTLRVAFEAATNLRALGVQEAEARGVPNLVGEVAVTFDLILVPTRVGRAEGGEHHSRRGHAGLVEPTERG